MITATITPLVSFGGTDGRTSDAICLTGATELTSRDG
jgi:hypothetical protein